MAQFYDQDNPNASYSRKEDTYVCESHTSQSKYQEENRYEKQVNNLFKNSVSSETQKARARIIKAQQRRAERRKRVLALALTCTLTGGVMAGVISELVDIMEENSIVYEQTSDFAKNVIYPNTHRTGNDKYYYYDYDEIADAIKSEGKDFSTELYKAYAYLGEEQTDCVMAYTGYESVAAYVKAAGFDDINEWVKSEKEKIILQSEVDAKSAELASMHSELNSQEVLNAVSDDYKGGK